MRCCLIRGILGIWGGAGGKYTKYCAGICSGGSIQSLLGRLGSFPEDVIRKYTKQLLHGLEYLHRNGIIHKDIKQYLLSLKARTVLMVPAKGSRTINKTIVKGYEDQQRHVDVGARHGSLCCWLTEWQRRQQLGAWGAGDALAPEFPLGWRRLGLGGPAVHELCFLIKCHFNVGI